MKECNTCKMTFSEDFFYAGNGYRCKACTKKYNGNYKSNRLKEEADYAKQYYTNTIVERRNKQRLEKYGTKEERKIKSKKSNQLWRQDYYILNKDKRNACSRTYAKKNRKDINERIRQKLKEESIFRVATRLRTLIYVQLKRKKVIKVNSTFKLTGCTPLELKLHLESLFLPGMSWDNHSRNGWHIDHKKPCCKFDLTIPDEQYKCFHYTNLQPLWAVDNFKKGGRTESI